MTFAIELENELVPEWRAKYLDYIQGKRKVTAFSRAVRNINAKSTAPGPIKRTTSPSYFASSSSVAVSHSPKLRANRSSRPIPISRQAVSDPERQPLNHFGAHDDQAGLPRYGSIVGSPTNLPSRAKSKRNPVRFDIPDPASQLPTDRHLKVGFKSKPSPLAIVDNGNASNADESTYPPSGALLMGRYTSMFQFLPNETNPTDVEQNSHPSIKRLMSLGGDAVPSSGNLLEAYRELDARQIEFLDFLDSELEKIETFYKLKEDQATERLKIIREQLHVMRDCHIDELVRARTSSIRASSEGGAFLKDATNASVQFLGRSWLDVMDSALESARHASFGQRAKGGDDLPSLHIAGEVDGSLDHVRHSAAHEVPYRIAKAKLKAAMQEFYRSLELLKSYALLNRKAFRKMNKKFDKAANAPPTLQYMSDKVNEAYFVKSHVLGSHIRAVEDLYARYFEGGNYKVATSKLRVTNDRLNDYNGAVFRNGLMATTGVWFGIAGLRSAEQLLSHPDPTLALNTSYLLQIYGGYFLMLFLMLLFCGDCKIWNSYRVNYVFIFEFDTRHHLDWRQLAELPCLCFLLLGLFLWLNFASLGEDVMFLFYPAILIGLTVLLIFLPAPTLFYRSRSWFLYSNWRLIFSGLYPVEFRDFFMGDMFCSLTYSIGNIELFFCLYGHGWDNPNSCSSSHSRVLGFFSTLPGIWRMLQCLRRYRDTGNKFPHLANCLKYSFTVLYYVSLSMYRLHKTNELFAIFIALATVNSFYCSVWDLVMDWSLLDPFASQKFLRDNLAFKPVWTYYTAMVIDSILRFNWVFYAIYTNDTEHAAILSFLIALSEICRRGVWTIFRVENEHCTNIGRVRASRDFPLPYQIEHRTPDGRVEQGYYIPATTEEDSALAEEHRRQGLLPPRLARSTSHTWGTSIPGAHSDSTEPSSTAIRRKKRLESSPLLRRVGSILHTAHAQDFERKKRDGIDEVKHDKDEEEEDVMDTHGHKVDAKMEVAKRVAEAVAEQAAKDAEEAEEEEEALQKFDWEGDGKLGESSREIEGRVKWRFGVLEEDGGDKSEDSGEESPGSHDGDRGNQRRGERS